MSDLVGGDGFDMYNGAGTLTGLQARWISGGSVTGISLVTGRDGVGKAVQIAPNSPNQNISDPWPAAYSAFCVGLALKPSSLPQVAVDANIWSTVMFLSGLTPMVGWRVNRLGGIDVYRYTSGEAGVLLGSSAIGILNIGQWPFLETEVVIHDSAGRVTIYRSGDTTPVVDLTGIDTRNGTPSTCNNMMIGSMRNDDRTGTFTYDDYYLANDAAKVGELKVETLRPGGDSSVALTPDSGGTNYNRVNETSVDGDTSYVQGTNVGDADEYDLGNLSTTPAAIYGVQAVDFARKTDAGTRAIYQRIKSGATGDDGAAKYLAETYARYDRMVVRDPDTSSAWNASGVNSLLRGPKVAV